MNLTATILLAVILLSLSLLGIGIKMLFKKDYTFKKQCSSVDPTTGKKVGCSCGSDENSTCHNS
jgi:hypothetical protein